MRLTRLSIPKVPFTTHNTNIFLLLIQKLREVLMHLSAPQLSVQTGMIHKTTKASQSICPDKNVGQVSYGHLSMWCKYSR